MTGARPLDGDQVAQRFPRGLRKKASIQASLAELCGDSFELRSGPSASPSSDGNSSSMLGSSRQRSHPAANSGIVRLSADQRDLDSQRRRAARARYSARVGRPFRPAAPPRGRKTPSPWQPPWHAPPGRARPARVTSIERRGVQAIARQAPSRWIAVHKRLERRPVDCAIAVRRSPSETRPPTAWANEGTCRGSSVARDLLR